MRRHLKDPEGSSACLASHAPVILAAIVMVLMTAGVSIAPSAAADPTDSLAAAVAATRGARCAPLRADPIVQQAAADVNDSTDKYLNHAARAVPIPDALPLLLDLGYGGTTAAMLTGAGKTPADAIKAVLLQGYLKIPDCSFVDYGVNSSYNAKKDMILTAVVLAG